MLSTTSLYLYMAMAGKEGIGFTSEIMREHCFTCWNTVPRERSTMSVLMESRRINSWRNGFLTCSVNRENSFALLKIVLGTIAGIL